MPNPIINRRLFNNNRIAATPIGTIFDIDFTTLANLDDWTIVNPGGSSYTLTANGVEVTGTPTTSFGGNALMYNLYESGLEDYVLEVWVKPITHTNANQGTIVTIKGDTTITGTIRKDSFVWFRNTSSAADGDGYRYFNDSVVLLPNVFNTSPLVNAVSVAITDEYKITITRTLSGSSAVLTMKIENIDNPASGEGSISYTYANISGQLDLNSSKFGIGTIGGTHYYRRMRLSSIAKKNPDWLVINDSKRTYSASTLANNWISLLRVAYPSLVFTPTGCQDDEILTASNKLPELTLIAASKAIVDVGVNDLISVGLAATQARFNTLMSNLASIGISESNVTIPELPAALGNSNIPLFNAWRQSTFTSANHVTGIFAESTDGSDNFKVSYSSDNLHGNDDWHLYFSGKLITAIA